MSAGLLAAGLLAAASEAPAQTPVCSDAPAAGQRIECTEDAASTSDIVIDAADVDISTAGQEVHGVHGSHQGQGDIRITLRGGDISTAGAASRGVYGESGQDAAGDIAVTVEDAAIETSGVDAEAVAAVNRGTGNVDVRVRSSTITTTAQESRGVQATHAGAGHVRVTVSAGTKVSTSGDDADGLIAYTTGTADVPSSIRVVVRDSTVTTAGNSAFGLFVQHGQPRGEGAGLIRVDLSNATVVTKGASSHAVYADQRSMSGVGRVVVTMNGGRLATEGGDDDPDDGTDTFSFGVLARQYGTGDVVIDVRGGSVTTKGSSSHGLYGIHSFGTVKTNGGDVLISVRSGSSVTTEGPRAHGIVGYHLGTLDSRTITIDVDGSSVVARGEGADAIRAGRLGADGAVQRAAALGVDGYRRQTVRVNGRVVGGAGAGAGIFLAGGGRVIIGSQGSVGARSGIAIRADGDTVVDERPVPRRLRVHLMPDGGPVSDLLDGRFVNDGGETVVAVNGTPLYDSEDGGRTGLWAPNGARDVTLVEGFTGLDFSTPDAFLERYAPRAAVYEALPGFLFRLHGRAGVRDGRMRAPETPVWVRLDGGTGSYEPTRGTTGGGYDFDRVTLGAGIDFGLGDGLSGSLGMQAVSGSADVSAPGGSGTIDASGNGLSLGLAWQGAGGAYADARLSTTWYDLDMASRRRGTLKRDVGATARTLDIEAGRRLAMDATTALTPRAWLSRADVAVDDFDDAVGARASPGNADRLTAGFGGTVEGDLVRNGEAEAASLFGSLGVAHTLSGDQTTVLVSGEELRSRAPRTGVHVGIGGAWRRDRLSLDGAVRAHGVGSGDTEYTGRLALRVAF